ncbi:hypothetical protein OS493_020422 [Desmophyllum pertusum]|uniref:Uncharacterized protein n=1 Tax=Desmophyllum pertusum TaxID=174260 RepID=A0A9W9Y8N4_9CNID|nr:hypothetical protein OS493_031127 [Desmophyllum pertusum]KAJ7378824.1 hypothetical protein OS493_020422 [Desmophyllum pertusum]
MSSDDELSTSASSSSDVASLHSEEEGEGSINSIVQPYQDEPLADLPADEDTQEEDDEDDEDGIRFATLEARFNNKESVRDWCLCGGKCKFEHLADAREYRCCREIGAASRIMTFDGSIESISCITQHTDYAAMSNREVLKHVAPMIRDKNGKTYRRRGNRSENDLLRAVGYRWLVRFMCGYLGWDNSRPLSACIYHDMRTRYPATRLHGYATAEERS